MADPYYPYATPSLSESDPGSIARTSFAGYIPSTAPSLLTSPHASDRTGLRGAESNYPDYPQKDMNLYRMGSYGVNDTIGSRVHHEPVVAAGHDVKRYPSHDDRDLSKKRDTSLGISPGVPDIHRERSITKINHDGVSIAPGDSNVLFVGGLPRDCTRREVGHLFRPFIGYKDIRVIHKEPRRSGDKAMILCFVEFIDAKCALTAMEALQGYKFDDKKPESSTLKIQFAHFPFRPPDHDQQLKS